MSRSTALSSPAPVTVRAPAKLNLHLRVGALRADGFHELTTVYHAVSRYDEVTASLAATLEVTVRGEGADTVPLDGDNLAVRAATALARRAGIEPLARLDIVKAIPVAGGLAGGSADAAAALLACDALWGTDLPRTALLDLAATLGSDVPFALTGGTALGTGRGEQLSPVPATGRWHWVLAFAAGGLSTPAVYRELDRTRPAGVLPADAGLPAVLAALRSGAVAALSRALGNDLQPAAVSLRPDLQRTLDAGAALGAIGSLVSGSGPTCAFLAGSAGEAARLAASLAGAGVCRDVRTACGPVAGAQVVPAAPR